jgi:putative membrane protein insertion efficiency factor
VVTDRNPPEKRLSHDQAEGKLSIGRALSHAPRRGAHMLIRSYQLSLSMLVGRHCRHWPSCSAYTDEAIQRHGLWRGGWIGVARICRCNPWGTEGVDLVCEELPPGAAWYRPWSYGRWRGVNAPSLPESQPSDSDAQPAAGDGTPNPHP